MSRAADPRDKTRPENNFHCFTGAGRALWQAIATGNENARLLNGRDGYRVIEACDIDGFAIRNGGIANPRETVLPGGQPFYRFFSRSGARRYGPDAWRGWWWMGEGGFHHLRQIARSTDQPMSRVVRNYMAVPNEWSDCAFYVRAVTKVKLKAWVGHGNPAHAAVSPASELRPRGDGGLYWMPGALAPLQLFIPGTRDELARYFDPGGQQRTDHAPRTG